MQESFLLNKEVSNKKVLLVDDIITTGATINEAYRALKSGNPLDVRGITITSARL